ncbi:hypothetical protein niasHS_015557 [Heterodera schachtii]|uniref:Uncharacterized protein n=1 Tax=Heterodera schachtii TaxID=97005 RepID=A0ABD2I4T6_HETSC
MAENLRQKIKDKIGTGYYSITSDGWQQPTKSPSLQSVTVHSVDENFVRSDFVLNVAPLYEAHTGENLAEHIEKCLIKNGFPMEKLVMMVRDDAKNMIKTCRILEIESQLPPALQIATILDPRFAYDENIWRKSLWADIEEELKNFAKSIEGQKNVSVDDEHLDDQNAAFSGLVHHDNVDLSALDEGGSSDESVRYDIWVTPKSPVNVSSRKLGSFTQIRLETGLSGEMAQNLLIIKANMNKLFLGPSNDVDEEENDENNENEAK